MSIANWQVRGDEIVEYSGNIMRCGAKIRHHNHQHHPLVRAAMWRGSAEAVAAAICAAHEGLEVVVLGMRISVRGVIQNTAYVLHIARVSGREKTADVRGWTIDRATVWGMLPITQIFSDRADLAKEFVAAMPCVHLV